MERLGLTKGDAGWWYDSYENYTDEEDYAYESSEEGGEIHRSVTDHAAERDGNAGESPTAAANNAKAKEEEECESKGHGGGGGAGGGDPFGGDSADIFGGDVSGATDEDGEDGEDSEDWEAAPAGGSSTGGVLAAAGSLPPKDDEREETALTRDREPAEAPGEKLRMRR